MRDRLFINNRIRNAPVTRPVNRRVFTWLGGLVLAGVVLAMGFIVGANKHFEAVTLGYEGEEMRRQAAQLEDRLRQLELERSRAMSPFNLEQEAKKLGLERPDAQKGAKK
ncbi:MAG TPA: hypothetical protein VJH03_06375 [Blastocatellia bacterium]|nr:hypothetical protein [Blastocatellia bacterium]